MQHIRLEKKIKTLGLFSKIKNIENNTNVSILNEKKLDFKNLNEDALTVSNEMKQVGKDLFETNGHSFSTFNFQQKFSYFVSLESKEKVLLKEINHTVQEISDIEKKIMKNIDQKNKILEKIDHHQNALRNEIEKKYLVDIS
jgi:hypothetical protein